MDILTKFFKWFKNTFSSITIVLSVIGIMVAVPSSIFAYLSWTESHTSATFFFTDSSQNKNHKINSREFNLIYAFPDTYRILPGMKYIVPLPIAFKIPNSLESGQAGIECVALRKELVDTDGFDSVSRFYLPISDGLDINYSTPDNKCMLYSKPGFYINPLPDNMNCAFSYVSFVQEFPSPGPSALFDKFDIDIHFKDGDKYKSSATAHVYGVFYGENADSKDITESIIMDKDLQTFIVYPSQQKGFLKQNPNSIYSNIDNIAINALN